VTSDLAVIIVSYNTGDLLRACLRALEASLERSRRRADPSRPGEAV
jgi:GT2 family glycosyltransferase